MRGLAGCLVIILLFPGWNLLINAQSASDSLQAKIDSIQDVRIEQLKRSKFKLDKKIEENRDVQARINDSLLLQINTLRKEIKFLEHDRTEKEHEIQILHQLLGESEQHSIYYRKKVKTVLWVFGPAFLLLLVTAFIMLYLIIRKSKKLTIERINAVSEDTRNEVEQMASRLDYRRKEELKKVRKGILKTVRKRFKRKK